MSIPDEVREKCGDVLLVGGTFFLTGKLVFENIEFPVDVQLKISPRSGITFPKVTLKDKAKREGAKLK